MVQPAIVYIPCIRVNDLPNVLEFALLLLVC